MNKLRIYAYVTDALKKKIESEARTQERSESQVIVLALKAYLDGKK